MTAAHDSTREKPMSVEPKMLDRWGMSRIHASGLPFDKREDGYWTPWHIAAEHIAALQQQLTAAQGQLEEMRKLAEKQIADQRYYGGDYTSGMAHTDLCALQAAALAQAAPEEG